jgi:hypothetical protein
MDNITIDPQHMVTVKDADNHALSDVTIHGHAEITVDLFGQSTGLMSPIWIGGHSITIGGPSGYLAIQTGQLISIERLEMHVGGPAMRRKRMR